MVTHGLHMRSEAGSRGSACTKPEDVSSRVRSREEAAPKAWKRIAGFDLAVAGFSRQGTWDPCAEERAGIIYIK